MMDGYYLCKKSSINFKEMMCGIWYPNLYRKNIIGTKWVMGIQKQAGCEGEKNHKKGGGGGGGV